MVLRITDPRNLTFSHWSSVIYNDNVGVPIAGAENDWRSWAIRVRELDQSIPDPFAFGDWAEWGIRAREVSNG